MVKNWKYTSRHCSVLHVVDTHHSEKSDLKVNCSKWFTVPLCCWWIFQVFILSFSYKFSLCLLSLCTHKRLTVLSCFHQTPSLFSTPPPFLPSVPLPPILLFLCLSHLFFVTSCSLVLFSVSTALTGHRCFFYISFVWNYAVNVCRERLARGMGVVTMCHVCCLAY